MAQTLHFIAKPSYLRVRKDRVVILKYALLDEAREVMEYREDLTYLHGGYGGAFPKVEQALEGLEVGAKVEVTLTPEEGFGRADPDLIITAPAAHLPPEAKRVGAMIQGEAADGHIVKFRVTRSQDGMVTVDGNHPLAGRTVTLILEIKDIRAATPQELEMGHALVGH